MWGMQSVWLRGLSDFGHMFKPTINLRASGSKARHVTSWQIQDFSVYCLSTDYSTDWYYRQWRMATTTAELCASLLIGLFLSFNRPKRHFHHPICGQWENGSRPSVAGIYLTPCQGAGGRQHPISSWEVFQKQGERHQDTVSLTCCQINTNFLRTHSQQVSSFHPLLSTSLSSFFFSLWLYISSLPPPPGLIVRW